MPPPLLQLLVRRLGLAILLGVRLWSHLSSDQPSPTLPQFTSVTTFTLRPQCFPLRSFSSVYVCPLHMFLRHLTLPSFHSTLWSTVAHGRPCFRKALRNHTNSYSQSSSTNNEQPCTPTSQANSSTSSEEPRRRPTEHAPGQLSEKWNRGNRGV